MTTPLLKWTGHPLADVGVATLCAMVGKRDPEELTLEDLDAAGKEIKAAYTDGVFMAYLSCVFPNSAYVNPTMKGESREKAMQRLLFPHRGPSDPGTEGIHCIFSGEPATHFLERSQMPMLTGAGVMNFFPAGLSEMAVAAPYLLAIQALPLGGRRSEGKLLIVHCDDPAYTLQFANQYLADNRRIIEMSRSGELPALEDPNQVLTREMPGGLNKEKRAKYPDAKGPESLVMSDLVKIITARKSGSMADSSVSVTAYHMSNSGQGPSLAIFNIPGEFVEFLSTLHGAEMGAKWARLVQRSWRAGKGGIDSDEPGATEDVPVKKARKKTAKPAARSGAGFSRNDLYNDLLAIFEHGYCDWKEASKFIYKHLLSAARRQYFKSGSELPLPTEEQEELIDWPLTEFFLRKVLGMEKEHLDRIESFAVQLAKVIDKYNDKQFYRFLVYTSDWNEYFNVLSKKHTQYVAGYDVEPFSFKEFTDIFFNASSEGKWHWGISRDLVSIRLVEFLHRETDFFPRNREAWKPNEAEEVEVSSNAD